MEKAILALVYDGRNEDFEYYTDEMINLIEASNMEVVAKTIQTLPNPNPATYVGSGKLKEIEELVDTLEANRLIIGDTLSPAQLRNIADLVSVPVTDRTGLILEIFAKRAGTREARLQVESANLKYMLPRLIGMRTTLGRQGGTSGSMSNRGQGEKQLELDRRHIERRISELDKELESIAHDREIQRGSRNRSNLPKVALVGYTNAGKSTLMNYFVNMSGVEEEKKVFEKDMLFATLDTTVRRVYTADKKDFLLSDTVGFVSNLPHSLIKAFRSTLEEAKFSDLLIIVLDAADAHNKEHRKVTEDTLRELECQDIPYIYAMNKADLLEDVVKYETRDDDLIYISAKTGLGIDRLIKKINETVYSDNEELELLIPYTMGEVVDLIKSNANVIKLEYLAEGTSIKADCPGWLAGKVKNKLGIKAEKREWYE